MARYVGAVVSLRDRGCGMTALERALLPAFARAVDLDACWRCAEAVEVDTVLRLRFNADGTRRQSYREVAAALGVTLPQARATIAKALRVLRQQQAAFVIVPAVAEAARTPADAPTLRETIAARVAELRADYPDARIVVETAQRNWPREEWPGVEFAEGLPWAYVLTVEDPAQDAG